MNASDAAMSSADAVRARLDHLVQESPRSAIELADRLLREAPDDPTTAVIAWTGIGRALYELGDLDRAMGAMRRAIGRTEAADADQVIAARMSASVIYAEAGQLSAAERELDAAEAAASGTMLGRVLTQRAFVLTHAGSLDAALAAANRAAEVLDVRRDPLGRLRLLVNRSVIQLQRGELAAARADLGAARALADRLGQDVIAALVVGNLGVAHARAGRLGVALDYFDEAERRYLEAGSPRRLMAITESDRAEALRAAGRHGEAVRSAGRAVGHGAASGNLVVHADTELALAHAWWAAGDPARGRSAAARAGSLMMRAGRRPMALQTRALGLEMLLADGAGTADLATLARSRRVAARLERHGWHDAARQLRSARLRHAWHARDRDDEPTALGVVADDVDRLATLRRSRRPQPALAGWYAESLRHWAAGDVEAAGRAALRGLARAGPDSRAATGAPGGGSLDAEAPAAVRDLERVVVASAVAGADPRRVLALTERMRALTDGSSTGTRFSLDRVRRALDGRVVLHFVVDGDDVWGTVVGPDGASTQRIASSNDVRAAVGPLRSWLDRGSTSSAAGDVAGSAPARSTAERLEHLLVPDALAGVPDGAGVIVVADDELVDVPWGALPIAATQPVVVVRSLAAWAEDAAPATPASRHTTLIVGPDVPHGRDDRRHVERHHARAQVLDGRLATAGGARDALGRPGLVQISAHGTFRADRPSLSSIRLIDGEATLDDLAPVSAGGRVAADVVVLASCSTAGASTRRGAQMHGVASELVRRGARVVVAPMSDVDDAECAEFVGALHRELARGTPVGRAVTAVRAAASSGTSLAEWSVASAFLCVGDDRVALDVSS